MSKSLMAEIKETEQLLEEYYELNEGLLAKVEKLETERNLAWGKGYKQGRDDAHQTIVALQAEVEELTAARDAFEQMYLTAAYGSAALKQEGE